MIHADHISFNADGTAWLVVAANPAEYGWAVALDRPCDTCDGTATAPTPEVLPCPDCIDGRHTWRLLVHDTERPSLLVSVIPGMVLPIYDGHETRPVGHIWINSDGDAWLHDINESYVIALPPAAAPGMWAVKLNVHQQGETREGD